MDSAKTSRRREHLFNTQSSNPLVDCLPVYSIPVAEEVPGRIPLGERLDDLLGSPGRCRMFGHTEM